MEVSTFGDIFISGGIQDAQQQRRRYDQARFHDLRHSYAVAAIESGDDIKTVQANLGHATASFTLDVYGHASQRMRQQSADRMEHYIQEILTTT